MPSHSGCAIGAAPERVHDIMKLGDMQVVGAPPAKLLKALAVISEALHPTFDAQRWIAHSGKTKESCVISSLAVRDFLFKIGFRDVEARPVFTVMRSLKDGTAVHSLGIGDESPRGSKALPGRWVGHMAVVIPSAGYLVDTTLYPAVRPAWPWLPGMIALPLADEGNIVFGMKPLAGFQTPTGTGEAFDAIWLDQPANNLWRKGGDAARWRREAAVAALVARFGSWRAD